jgi:hypothetical protein
MSRLSFPKCETVWQGAILHSIANAIMVGQNVRFAHYLRWDDHIYVLQGLDGSYGTIGFFDHTIGAFFDSHSRHNPIGSEAAYDINVIIGGMPKEHRRILEESLLPYHIRKFQGKNVPIITAAFWDCGQLLASTVPWEEVCRNGGDIITSEVIADNLEESLSELQDAYQMSDETVVFLRHIIQLRGLGKHSEGSLSDFERSWLRDHCESDASFKAAFQALGILGL